AECRAQDRPAASALAAAGPRAAVVDHVEGRRRGGAGEAARRGHDDHGLVVRHARLTDELSTELCTTTEVVHRFDAACAHLSPSTTTVRRWRDTDGDDYSARASSWASTSANVNVPVGWSPSPSRYNRLTAMRMPSATTSRNAG